MPVARARIVLERTFLPQDYERIKHGLVPQEMEDKWFMYFEGEWLYIHRSWTGLCIYQVRLEPAAAGYRVAEAWVNQDPQQYRPADDNYEAQFLLWLIDCLLLGKDFKPPAPRS